MDQAALVKKARGLIEKLAAKSIRIDRGILIHEREEDGGAFESWRLWLIPDSKLSRRDLRLTIARAEIELGLVDEFTVVIMEADEPAATALMKLQPPQPGQRYREIAYATLGSMYVREGLMLDTEVAPVG
jgi:hypothetical protein